MDSKKILALFSAAAMGTMTVPASAFTEDLPDSSALPAYVDNAEEPSLSTAEEDVVEINETNFPDATFRQYVSDNFDTDNSGGLSQAELDAVTSIDVSGTEEAPNTIASLNGIEYFTKLNYLYCNYNQLTSLDVSNNTVLKTLFCSNNQLTKLDVTKNTVLTYLNFQFNQISSIDLSKNTALEKLICDHNKFTELELTSNKALELIWCGENEFTALDFSPNTALTQIVCRNNPYLASINVSKNANLDWLDCGNSPITSLDVSNNSALTTLICDNNLLTQLNVTNNLLLTRLDCQKNMLTSLDVSSITALTVLSCSNNTYSIGDITDSYSLSNLPEGFEPSKADNWTGAEYDESTNSLKNFTSETVTYTYDCGYGDPVTFTLTASSIPEAADVVEINETTFPDETFRQYVTDNFDTDNSGGLSQAECDAVTEINVAGTSEAPNTIADLTGIEYFTKLENLNFQFNQVSSLDLSKNTALKKLVCDHNKFTELDLTNNKALELIWCGENEFTSLDFSPNTALTNIVCRNNPGLTDVNVSSNANLEWLDCGNCPLNSLDVSNNTALATLICDRNQLTSLDVTNNTTLTFLNFQYNQISSIDLSKNTALKKLVCDHNKFTKLDLTNNKALELIWCGENEFTALDFSPNTALKEIVCRNNPNLTSVNVSSNANLKWLDCGNCPITSLDVSNNAVLETLKCDGAHLTSLDLSKNTALTTLKCDNNTYSIGDVIDSYSLSNLPEGFDPSKADNWTGATYDEASKSLTKFTSTTVTYTYDCGYGEPVTFTLTASSISESNPELPAVKATSGDKKVTLSWNAVSGATKYRVFYRANGVTSWNYVETTSTSRTISGLTNGKKYDFLVIAYNGSKWSTWTNANIVNATPVSSAPALPTVKTTAGDKKVTLSWNAVSGATKYRVFYRANGVTSWNYVETTSTSSTISGLTNGKKYDFLVIAYNGSKWSKWSNADVINATPVSSAPALPTVKTTVGDRKVTLSWNAVSGATKYRVFYRANGVTSWNYVETTSTSRTISGLTNGKKYDFLVIAYNGSKWSAWTSANIINATPVSSAPALPTVKTTVGDRKVTLSWNAVSGAAKYRVFYRANGVTSWNYVETTSTSRTISGLTNGKKYDFLVIAYNGSKWSAWTSANIINATPVSSAPALPTVKTTAGDKKITLSWNTVSGATKYRVFYRANGVTSWNYVETTSTSRTISGLTNGKKYDFLVIAYNGSKWSVWTSANIVNATPQK